MTWSMTWSWKRSPDWGLIGDRPEVSDSAEVLERKGCNTRTSIKSYRPNSKDKPNLDVPNTRCCSFVEMARSLNILNRNASGVLLMAEEVQCSQRPEGIFESYVVAVRRGGCLEQPSLAPD
ncbi:hypothetical protein J6590_010900 [Homalodisca vitripennis]|nr:hypothetical protein J6590_010900 [Homalodisca vitripennis]